MSVFAWRDEFSVNNVAIDEQHKTLFSLAGELHVSVVRRNGPAVMEQILNKLLDYAGTHFADEEALMRAHRYPQYMAHKSEHDRLRRQAMELKDQFMQGEATAMIDLLNFLRQWLERHIKVLDQRVANHIANLQPPEKEPDAASPAITDAAL